MYRKGWKRLRTLLEANNELSALKLMDEIQCEIDCQKYICIKDYNKLGCDFMKGTLYDVFGQDRYGIWIEHAIGELKIPHKINVSESDFNSYFKLYGDYLMNK